MPTSDTENKDVVVRWFKDIKPHTTVDVGCGEGTYRKLIANSVEAPQSLWVGVEAWGPYVSQFNLKSLYNEVYVGQAEIIDYSKVIKLHSTPILFIMGDMLEHMPKDTAKQLINTAKATATHIIISIPLVHLDQDAYEGNWFETHVDHWDYVEMCTFLGGGLKESIQGPILGYFLWQRY